MQVAWLDSAVNDLVRLREFIEKNNPIAANKAANKIIEVAKMLEEQPELGKPAQDLPDYRDLNIKSLLVF
jgi:plasmid stabilization system protein ParE